MQTHITNESAAAERTTGAAVQARRADGGAAEPTQRHQQLADSSPQAMQWKRQAQTLAASPAAATLQRCQHMANESHQTTQVHQQAAITAASASGAAGPVQRAEKPNNTGLPDQLKSGIESLSGMSMDHVRVHYNSDKPAQLQAHAYAQGSEIHVGPGQESHLPHEAWHVVQQRQGRVAPTMQMHGGVMVNDDVGLETEADVMGASALATGQAHSPLDASLLQRCPDEEMSQAAQRKVMSTASSSVLQRDACYLPDQDTPYANMAVTGSVGPGEKFDPNQRFPILAQNFQGAVNNHVINHVVDLQSDDSDNSVLIDRGTISEDEAAIDHVVPADSGGCNTPQNAQVLSVTNNSAKNNTYPHGGYSGSRVYDLGTHTIYDDQTAARNAGADMTTIDSDYAMAP